LDVAVVQSALREFISRYKTQFEELSVRRPQLLEVVATTLAVNHYASKGYQVSPGGLVQGAFRVKASSRGHPWNYSWWRVNRNDVKFEIHSNLAVAGAYGSDGGIYVVDVAVVPEATVPHERPQGEWLGAKNESLITFLESKALVIYPMLIAQFIGIVFELKPNHLAGRLRRGFLRDDHFRPSLVSLGYLTATSHGIVDAFGVRRFIIGVLPASDTRVRGYMLNAGDPSPLD
jgi:hypothetical protein